ncbi:MAG: P1 family peptidase, partial [Proteobacteria bacterium]|nr:P1 family peptidase [Pseudomonadota bacterium]
VPGVLVGHATIVRGAGPLVRGEGPVRTGVTAILPHGEDTFAAKVPAAAEVFNGFGKSIGLMHDPEMSDAQRALIAEKRAAYAQLTSKKKADLGNDLFPEPKVADAPREEDLEVTGDGGVSFPPSASMCHKCSAKAIVIMDGCATCLNCGYSKCG